MVIPLMMVEGYEADGWLGLMLGTSMWYAFYGDVLTSESVFESRIDFLSRELGDRGRADAVVPQRARSTQRLRDLRLALTLTSPHPRRCRR